jgi:CheY-like chemotaxis protein
VFIDILMPAMDGFEVLKTLSGVLHKHFGCLTSKAFFRQNGKQSVLLVFAVSGNFATWQLLAGK